MDRVECGEWIGENVGRDIVVVGASIESDAHTVGIDAIIQMKGFHGHFGLERFKNVVAYNMGSQVPCETLIAKAKEVNADAILVSSLYGHGELDCRGLREKCSEAGLKDILLYVGGNIVVGKQPFNEVEARFKKMGFNRVFGPGTAPEETIKALKEDLHLL